MRGIKLTGTARYLPVAVLLILGVCALCAGRVVQDTRQRKSQASQAQSVTPTVPAKQPGVTTPRPAPEESPTAAPRREAPPLGMTAAVADTTTEEQDWVWETAIPAKIQAMSVRSKVAQTLMVGILEGWSLRSPGILGEIPAGSVILYKRNVKSKSQLTKLVQQIQTAVARGSDVGTFIAIDHEGGRVNRLPRSEFTAFPPNSAVGPRSDGLAFVTDEATTMAEELREVGIQIDLAPVVDVCVNPDNPDIKDRAYSAKTNRVAELGGAFIDSALHHGLFVCAKHFPGYGPISRNPHEKLPVVDISKATWDAVHRPAFQRAIDAGVPAVMTGHVVYPALDSSRAPASMSRVITTGILRNEMGFRGMILTDDLEMGAVTSTHEIGRGGVAAMKAGADMLLVCHTPGAQQSVLHAVEAAAKRGDVPEERLNEAVTRILWYKYQYGLWRPRQG